MLYTNIYSRTFEKITLPIFIAVRSL